jgi:hypothetical protein
MSLDRSVRNLSSRIVSPGPRNDSSVELNHRQSTSRVPNRDRQGFRMVVYCGRDWTMWLRPEGGSGDETEMVVAGG